ncbi:MAG: TIGR00269 family protein, partial [Thermodesulfobacteriota bacterium]
SGQKFCRSCFIEYFEDKARDTMLKYNMVGKGEDIGIALSGGKDSITTLFLMNKIAEKLGLKLYAISIDEGIAGYREKSLKLAKRACSNLDIPLHVVSFAEAFGKSLDEIVKIGELKPCTYCGVFRRKLLNEKAGKLGLNKIATGHNLDDEVQAILMNYIRGDIERLARQEHGRKNKPFVERIKPLKRIPEKEVALYALLKDLEPSFDECPYSRESFRVAIRDFINSLEAENAGIKYSIASGYEKIAPSLKTNNLKFTTCEECGEPTSRRICKACELAARLGI